MNITFTLDICLFGLAVFDAWLSRRRIIDYGINVELNQTIHTLYNKFGVEIAVLIAIMVPTILICTVCTLFKWPVVLAILLGFRLHLGYIQLESLTFEEKLKKFTEDLKDTDNKK